MIMFVHVFLLIILFVLTQGTLVYFGALEANNMINKLKLEMGTKQYADQSDECFNDIQAFSQSTSYFQMIDAWGQLPTALAMANTGWQGSHSECLLISEQSSFNGSEISTRLSIATLNSPILRTVIEVGVCLPTSCTPRDIRAMFNATLTEKSLLTIEDDGYIFVPPKMEYHVSFWVAAILFGLLGFLVIFGSVADIVLMFFFDPKNEEVKNSKYASLRKTLICKIILPFSLYTNVPKIFDVNPSRSANTLDCLNGIRVLSMFWVISGHTFVFPILDYAPTNLGNFLYVIQYVSKHVYTCYIVNATFSVDNFFLISGILLVYILLEKNEKSGDRLYKPLFWAKFYFHRIFRLSPCFIAATAFAAGLYQFTGQTNNAMFQPEGVATNCQKYWWTNVLYINDFFKTDKQCIGWTWYLACDFQMFAISPIFIILLKRFPILGIISVILLIHASCVTRLIISAVEKMAPDNNFVFLFSSILPSVPPYDDHPNWGNNLYYMSPFRFGPYGVGMLLGWLFHRYKPGTIKIRVWINVVMWFLSIGVMQLLLFAIHPGTKGHYMGLFLACVYNGYARTIWSCCIAWIIFSCVHGYGFIANRFLAMKVWTPLTRLTYIAYLIHPFILMIELGSRDKAEYMLPFKLFIDMTGNILFVYLIAIPTCALLESPFVQLEKVILPQGKPKPKKEKSINQEEE